MSDVLPRSWIHAPRSRLLSPKSRGLQAEELVARVGWRQRRTRVGSPELNNPRWWPWSGASKSEGLATDHGRMTLKNGRGEQYRQ